MPEHSGKEKQAIENPPLELDSLPSYYAARHEGESMYAHRMTAELRALTNIRLP